MTAAAFDFFEAQGLATPPITEPEAAELVLRHFGRAAAARSLGSQQDANFLLTGPAGDVLGVLKVANAAFSPREIAAQDAATAALADALPGLRLPTTLAGPVAAGRAPGGAPLGTARILRFLDGGTLAGPGHLRPEVVRELGAVAGAVSRALAGFDHPGLERVVQWDLRHAGRVIDTLAGFVADPARRAVVDRVLAREHPAVLARADRLPTQAVHGDLTDDNVVCRAVDGVRLPDGVIDFGDLTESWAVAELAVAVASLLHHDGASPFSVLPAIAAFHAARPLAEAEIDVLWPLVKLRGAVLVVSGAQQAAIDGANAYALERLEGEWRILEVADGVPSPVLAAATRQALGLPVRPLAAPRASALPAGARGAPAALDLSVGSDALDAGRWLDPACEQRLAGEALGAGAGVVHTRWGERRLTRTVPLSTTEPAVVATGVDVWFAADTVLRAPFPGALAVRGARHVLTGDGAVLTVEADGPRVPAADRAPRVAGGDPIVEVQGGTRVRLTLADPAVAQEVPAFVPAAQAEAWGALLADPTPLVGGRPAGGAIAAAPGEAALLARRDRAFAPVQEHYYAAPPQIERGWRQHLLSVDARSLLDMVNNVALLGHGHPGLARAVQRQMSRLNTNSRFHYAAVVELSERLAALLPDPLDTVFLVNSGSEANDLALRIAMAATGRTEVAAVREAYHGWTYLSDAVSTSVADNPGALGSRPDWVQVLDAPNAYRGRHRGERAGDYAVDAVAQIDAWAAEGRPPGAFICEPFYGNAGGLALPDGYLGQVHAAIRRHGGLTVADEVQVGLGRLGSWFWGFEQQGVVPDVVTVAKGLGNGHPLGAVVTSREIAERYRSQGYFFSSAGGSPVSCVVGLAVLDAIRDERLQDNAERVGRHLRGRLEELAARHPLIGAVHGSGLYLGVELVGDRVTLEPAPRQTAAVCERLLDLGVVVQPTSDRGNVLKVKPPLCLDVASADVFADALDHVLTHGA